MADDRLILQRQVGMAILAAVLALVALNPAIESALSSAQASRASGRVDDGDWGALRRPLRLPTLAAGAPCPRTGGRSTDPALGHAVGDGPVYATLPFIGATNLGKQRPSNDGWYVTKVVWLVRPDYAGPVMIRGHQIDGSGEMRFAGNESAESARSVVELRLVGIAGMALDAPGWNFWTSGIFVRTPGCYAYQVDGIDFSDVVVFEAVKQRPGELTSLPPLGRLPRDLYVAAGVGTGPGMVRLALLGVRGLAIQIDVGPSTPSEPIPPGLSPRQLATTAGAVLWQADPRQDWPRVAVWDDGWHRYRLLVLGDGSAAWSEADLRGAVEAFAAAAESPPTIPTIPPEG